MNKTTALIFVVVVCLASCSADSGGGKRARIELIKEEKGKRNPVQKGRYECWDLAGPTDKVASPLYILSDEIYQIDETTGRYVFHPGTNTIEFTNGTLQQGNDPLIGYYTPRGTPTSGGGKTLETMIEIRRKIDVDTGGKKVVMQCNCSEFKY